MKIKVNKHKLNIHYRGSPWGSRTQQHAYCLRYAHSYHIESHLGKKQPQAKIAIAFLFGQLHFNNVTSHALFYGGHLVMRSKRFAVQNQGITLSLTKERNQTRVTVQMYPSGRGVHSEVLYGEALPQGPTPYPFIYHFLKNGTPFTNLIYM